MTQLDNVTVQEDKFTPDINDNASPLPVPIGPEAPIDNVPGISEPDQPAPDTQASLATTTSVTSVPNITTNKPTTENITSSAITTITTTDNSTAIGDHEGSFVIPSVTSEKPFSELAYKDSKYRFKMLRRKYKTYYNLYEKYEND